MFQRRGCIRGLFFGGLFIRSLLFAGGKEPEVIVENNGSECLIRVQNGGGKLYEGLGFIYVDTLKLFYEDTGRVDFELYELGV